MSRIGDPALTQKNEEAELGVCPLCLKPIRSTQRVWMKNGEPTVHSSCRDQEAALRARDAPEVYMGRCAIEGDHPAHWIDVSYGGAVLPQLWCAGLREKVDPTEAVDHPAHYGGADNPYEAIKVIENWQLGFRLGNCVKYLSRAGKKGSELEDLKKARWYLQREIDLREAEMRE